MDKLSYKLKNLNSAFRSLELAYRYLTVELDKLSLSNNLDLKLINQDSVIQRFEFTVELLWKYLREYIQVKFLIADLPSSPAFVFREALKVNLLSVEETEQSLQMIKDRNLTSHTYKNEIAEDILSRMDSHIKLIKKIIKVLI
jgi:nucleotidyltransferase substrate binding protein (TIGR01987 family)